MVGKCSVGDQIRKTQVRFRNITDYEAYIISIDEGYDAKDAIFSGYIYEINTPHFNLIDLKMEMVVSSNMKLLIIMEVIVLYQQKFIVL